MFLRKVYNLLEALITKLDRVDMNTEQYYQNSQKKLGTLEWRIDSLEKKIDRLDFSGLEVHRTDDRIKELIKQAMDEYKTDMEKKVIKKDLKKK